MSLLVERTGNDDSSRTHGFESRRLVHIDSADDREARTSAEEFREGKGKARGTNNSSSSHIDPEAVMSPLLE
jgi:hypothetical protein